MNGTPAASTAQSAFGPSERYRTQVADHCGPVQASRGSGEEDLDVTRKDCLGPRKAGLSPNLGKSLFTIKSL